ncbi:ADR078Cp [Eremothecium gossypii ATCC 10895]|uniref:Probable glycosidase CRR1 n=1 Tax=Eremothecium gossypii (strain ATCC 10895 / CBS 109.51 / FGSC 9923 / NRRL Y-1056) TaxID=284811 RepID=CRR1_EREGS|nr:ADR078Cp [Eremothecium gossypii ATCC 10895]Q75A41.1 RecName: Full=Probable glycosidase CRR1; AltName: Full=CRH-related protein 1; Flags: Precursor [Eremothecium gossypii ATCC 10895]AAS51998.1 ADR078Cp [Eremothecium gossypii ATCC 10895]AEY96298.1 FADR078Cp [Eremothecium gossypii FDAG1]
MSKRIIQLILLSAFARANYVEPFKSNPYIACSEASHCPKEWPCCSQYGQCGSGPLCISGCNPKFSHSPESCVPVPALLPQLEIVASDDKGVYLEMSGQPALVTKFQRKSSAQLLEVHHEEQQYGVSALEQDLNSRGLIHFPDYMITSKPKVAREMLEQYDFIHSGFISVDGKSESLILGMPKKTTGSLISSSKVFLYGRAAVTMKTSRGPGVITAIVFMSSTQDEIDYEFVGSELHTVQTNYYYQGELNHSRMRRHSLPSNSHEEYHIYEVDWDAERIHWMVDGEIVRTLYKRDTWDPVHKIYKYPQTPMMLQISLWPAGTPDAPQGTIEWAGGLIDWENAPDIKAHGQLAAQIQRVAITPYNNDFCPEIHESMGQWGAQNSEEEPFRVAYGYESNNGRFDPKKLKWYTDARLHLSSWHATGIKPTAAQRQQHHRRSLPHVEAPPITNTM